MSDIDMSFSEREGPRKESEASDTTSSGTFESTSTPPSLDRPASDEGTGAVFFVDLTDAQFLEQMDETDAEARHLGFENEVFFHFLEDNDPPGYQEAVAMIEQAMFLKYGDIEEVKQATKVRSSRVSLASIFSILEGKGPRVNLVQKSDMVLKAIEEKQAALELFLKRSHRTRRKLLSEMEEFHMREVDITVSRNVFEHHIVIEGVDSLTQRIPAEKFLKYMDDWLRSAGLDIEKLRLRTEYIKQQYRKVSATLERRKELRKNLHAVDFDKLKIENKNFGRQLDSKTVNMMELKKMFAESNRVLNDQKKYVMECHLEGETYRKQIKKYHEFTKEIESECEMVKLAVLHAIKEYDNFMFISNNYRVPDVMQYVNLKKDHAVIVKQIKIWQRKKKVLDISLQAAIREMMNITGCKKLDPSWLEDVDEQSLAGSFRYSCRVGEAVIKDAPLSRRRDGSKHARKHSSTNTSIDGRISVLKHRGRQSEEHRGRVDKKYSGSSSRISWLASGSAERLKGLVSVKS